MFVKDTHNQNLPEVEYEGVFCYAGGIDPSR
jgi:hypothetical protein